MTDEQRDVTASLPAHEQLVMPPGGGFRFAVGVPDGPKSTEYKVFSAKNSSDLYLVIIPTAETMKISFHESGDWQHSFLSQVAMQYVDRNADRHVDRWTRHEPFSPGWRRAYVITIPRSELRRTDSHERDNVRWISDPGAGYWINIHILFRDAGSDTALQLRGAALVGELSLVDGRRAVVLANAFKPQPDHARNIARDRDMILRNAEMRSQIADANHPVVGLHGHDHSGVRGTTELSLTPPPVGFTEICTGDYASLDDAGLTFRRHRGE
ncbi:hypothetical protein [Amycolatopsis sp. lyj-84]|uniref:hypothetical protein n=1 Tax=Amycolatopsis sp. lyj-84 TaxID=2789284 RepID=UPI00397E589A